MVAPAGIATARPGWSTARTSYLGRYHVLAADSGSRRPAATGLLAGIVQEAEAAVGGRSGRDTVGELTVFMRPIKVNGRDVDVPSGILALHGGSSTSVYYLTNLAHHGRRHTATLVGGSFDGPRLGTLRASAARPTALAAVMTLSHVTSRLHFLRFSANPHP